MARKKTKLVAYLGGPIVKEADGNDRSYWALLHGEYCVVGLCEEAHERLWVKDNQQIRDALQVSAELNRSPVNACTGDRTWYFATTILPLEVDA